MIRIHRSASVATIAVIMMLAIFNPAASDEPRLWTSADNMFRLNASFISATQNDVKLKRADNGKEIVVPLAKLSEADRVYLKSIQTTKDLATRENHPSVKPAIEPSLPKLSLNPVDENTYNLEPLGILTTPATGFKWEELKGQPKQTYRATKEGDPNVFTLTIHSSAVSNQDRKEFIQNDWGLLQKELVSQGGTFRNQVLPINKERFEYIEWLTVESEEKGRQSRNLIVYGFMAGITMRIHHTGPQATMGNSVAAKVLEKFNILPNRKNESIDLPLSVARELTERIALLKSLVAKQDYRALLYEFTRPEAFREFSERSELEVNQAAERYFQTNGALLKQAISTLQVSEGRYNPKEDVVFFPKSKPNMLSFTRRHGRWTLDYPKVFKNASAADVIAAGKSESTLKNLPKQASPDRELAVSKVDDQWIMFSPYGKVPIPEQAFEWKIVDKSIPTIESIKIVMIEGNPNPQGSDLLRVEIHPPAVGESRQQFIVKLDQQLTDQLKSSDSRVRLVESYLGDEATKPVPDTFGLFLEGRSSRSIVAASFANCLFLSDKTVVVRGTVSGSEKSSGRVRSLVSSVTEGIKKDSSWYPQSNIDPKIKKEVTEIITEIEGMLAAGEYEKLLTKFIPADELAKIKSNPEEWDEVVRNFKTRKSIDLVGHLKEIDWKTASYDESEKTLTFGSSRLRFINIDGIWRLR